jgi:hypothetical protein
MAKFKYLGTKADWIGEILRRNCLLKHITEVKIGMGRQRPRSKQPLNDLKEKNVL